jgi:hypothetical protein
MNSIVKREQRNRAFNTRWVTECERSVRRVPDKCSTNTDFPRPAEVPHSFIRSPRRLCEQFCSEVTNIDYLERSRPADVVSPHIHKIKQIAECLQETSMRTLRLIYTTAAILLLGASVVSAQGMKTDETPSVPAAQQNAPAEKMAPAGKSDKIKVPEKTGQAAPTAPASDNKQQTTEGVPAGAAAKGSSDANGSPDLKSKRTARHVGARYAGRHHGPLYNSYRGGYRGCRGHGHSWTPWLWC